MSSLVPEFIRKPFCFPCERRTKKLQDAIEASKKALAARQDAFKRLKESINERTSQPA